jgi:hypothetical protein
MKGVSPYLRAWMPLANLELSRLKETRDDVVHQSQKIRCRLIQMLRSV